MAEKKKKSSRSATTRSSSVWGINKISMFTIVAITVLYLISAVLSLVGVSLKIVGVLQGAATAVALSIVSVLAWRYVQNKDVAYRVLYFICLLVVVACIIVPLLV